MINLNNVKNLLKSTRNKRPVLEYINFTETEIIFTNSYSLVKISHNNPIEFKLNIFTGFIDTKLNYPNTNDIIDSIMKRPMQIASKLLIINNMYKLDDYYFDKKLVDDTLKTIDLKLTNDILGQCSLYIHEDSANLIMSNGKYFILILGLKGVSV